DLASVEGRAGIDGVTALLSARGVRLPRGMPGDPPTAATAWGLANREEDLFLAELVEHGVAAVATGPALVRRLESRGVRTAVVSPSRHARHVLGAAGVADLFDVRVDGVDAAEHGLAGPPDPAMLLAAAERLGVRPSRAAVVDDAPAGVEAGRRGGFALVIGVDREGGGPALVERGADVVVGDLADVELTASATSPATGCALCVADLPGGEWAMAHVGDDADREGTREALLTLTNGYLATRGARPEARADGVHYPGTYVAGVYNRLTSRVDGREHVDESLVNLPSWLPLTFRAEDGAWLGGAGAGVRHDHVALDVRRGMLQREAVVVDAAGRRTRLRQRRIVSLAAPHLAALETVLVPENWSGRLAVRSGVDGDVTNGNVAAFAGLADRHLRLVGSGEDLDGAAVWLEARTVQSHIHVVTAARTTVAAPRSAPVARRRIGRPERLGHELAVDVRAGEAVTLDKVAAVFTSRDRAISEPRDAAIRELAAAGDFDVLLAAHDGAWAQRWRHLRLGMDDGERDQLAVNVHMFHVAQTLSAHTADLDVGVPARGLHGEGYRGHVFWDELFVFPLLNYRTPQLTRALLLYRHRRLPEARRLARAGGRRGAQFAWQSGSDGREETPDVLWNPRAGRWMADNSRRQHHVNLAIAYNVWQYWQVTADAEFLAAYGAELLIEISRFWASVARHDPVDDRYDVRGVMGPDEFHDGYPDRPGQGIDNNAYVNVMTAWVLARTLEGLDALGRERAGELRERLAVDDAELARWDHVSRRLRVPFLGNGLLAQFEGYESLAELDWDGYRGRYGNIGRLDLILDAEGDTTNRYRASKQADVLMLFYLFTTEELGDLFDQLGYSFDPATVPATVEHYLARTSHGSTLSRIAHAWVLARTDRERSWALLRDALAADIADTQGGTTREGIHLGAMAGTADILQRCYTGLEARGGVLWFNPRLPAELHGLDLDLLYRGQWLTVHVDERSLTLHARPGPAPPVRVGHGAGVHVLAPGRTLHLGLGAPGTRPGA
ncbi:MAG TPA: HAD-IA family hydrolase, partial [Acidimicrobiales bacterium]|nr:HAD-IA family hydrolase [Acidimicrobiales bacterium]